MLRRPGSPPGCAWMKRLNDRIPAPGPVDPRAAARYRRWMVWFWIVWAIVMASGWWTTRAVERAPAVPYESPLRIAGLPLLAYGDEARGIVAVGGIATGVVAIGGVAVGAVAFGGVALGGLALGGVSAGLFALGGLAVGWWALGGGAIGYCAFGGLAIGGHAYAGGGVALGYHEASGHQKERLFG